MFLLTTLRVWLYWKNTMNEEKKEKYIHRAGVVWWRLRYNNDVGTDDDDDPAIIRIENLRTEAIDFHTILYAIR